MNSYSDSEGLLLRLGERAGLGVPAGAILQSGTHASLWALQRDARIAKEFGVALAAQVSSSELYSQDYYLMCP